MDLSLSLSLEQEEQVKTIDRLLSALDPEYATKMWEQLRIMGVLKQGSAGDPGENPHPFGVFSVLVQYARDQAVTVQELETRIAVLETDMRSAARVITALIPPEPRNPRTVVDAEYTFFIKYGQNP